jgi:hypothetical protein
MNTLTKLIIYKKTQIKLKILIRIKFNLNHMNYIIIYNFLKTLKNLNQINL